MATHDRSQFEGQSFETLLGVQRVCIADYKALDKELQAASELYKSGQTESKAALKVVEELARRKVGVFERIRVLGLEIDERDGTAAARRRHEAMVAAQG